MKSRLTCVLIMTKMSRPLLVAMVLLCSTLGLAQASQSLPLKGGTMTGPIAGAVKFSDPQFGTTAGGLSLKDARGNVMNTGSAVSFGFNYLNLETATAKAQLLVTDYNNGEIEVVAGSTYLQIAAKGITLAPDGAITMPTLKTYANNAAAIAGGLVVGNLYRTGTDPDVVCVVH
jgi:hypothetical protein